MNEDKKTHLELVEHWTQILDRICYCGSRYTVVPLAVVRDAYDFVVRCSCCEHSVEFSVTAKNLADLPKDDPQAVTNLVREKFAAALAVKIWGRKEE